MNLIRLLVLPLLLLLFSHSVIAKIILSAPPREKPEVGETVYGPIAKGLSKILNEEVVYQHPTNWTRYSRDMRAGKYDIVFDGPHFASWRIKHSGHKPVARLSGHLQFYILAKKSDKKLTTIEQLNGKRFCGLATPNLGTMSTFGFFQNPFVQPEIKVIKGGMRIVLKKFMAGECRAAVVRDELYKKLSKNERKKIRIIAKSKKMPNQAFTTGRKISGEKRNKISKYLASKSGILATDALLTRFSKKKKYWVAPKTIEFKGLSILLEEEIYGWKR